MIHHVSMNDVERAKAFYDPSKALRGWLADKGPLTWSLRNSAADQIMQRAARNIL
jgi:hypothetical protein